MSKFKLISAILIYFFMFGISASACESSNEALRHIPVIVNGKTVDMSLKEAMAYFKVPSVSISLVQDNIQLWSCSKGYISSAHRKKVNIETLYQAGSLSKSIAAVTALKLVDEGKLSVDDDVNLSLKGWLISKPDKYKDDPITLRQLLSMSSGLDTGGYYGYSFSDKLPTLIDILSGKAPANNPALQLIHKPGSQYDYSGGGYEVVELLLNSIESNNFASIAQKEILQPLAMQRSYFSQPLPGKLFNNAAEATNQNGKKFPEPWRISPEFAAGGLWTTSEDLTKFVIAVNNAYAGNPGSILSVNIIKEALTKQKNTDYGMGFAIAGTGSKLHYMKLGQNVGYQGWLVGYPVTKQGAVVLTNSDNGRELAQDIIYALAKFYRWPTNGKLKDAWMLEH